MERNLRMLTQLAARIVLVEALFTAFVFLMMLAGRADGPGRRALDIDWPLSGLLVLAVLAASTYAGLALLRTPLCGEGVPPLVGLFNVLSVGVVALLNARSVLSYVLHLPDGWPVLSVVLYVLLFTASVVAAAGAAVALWSSWRARGAGSITA